MGQHKESTSNFTKQQILITKSNNFLVCTLRITNAFLVNDYYNYVMAFTVFTSTLKFTKFIAFHKDFMQISASLKLCFRGLGTFFVEFAIVFFAFSAFFYFSLKTDLARFRTLIQSLEYTLAMSIGRFNFGALRKANPMAVIYGGISYLGHFISPTMLHLSV